MRGVGGEPGQDAVRIAVGKRVDLHRVVGARRDQLAVLWRGRTEMNRPSSKRLQRQPADRWRPNLERQRVRLLPHGDELGIVVIQTLPDANISVVPAGHQEPEGGFTRLIGTSVLGSSASGREGS